MCDARARVVAYPRTLMFRRKATAPDGSKWKLGRRWFPHRDLDGSFPYTAMLEDQVAGRNDSWAIRWHASCFLKAMLTLYPGRSLVENIGNDASGTHCSASAAYSQDVANADVRLGRIPLTESREAHRAFVRFFRRRQPMPLVSRASRVLRGLYQKLA